MKKNLLAVAASSLWIVAALAIVVPNASHAMDMDNMPGMGGETPANPQAKNLPSNSNSAKPPDNLTPEQKRWNKSLHGDFHDSQRILDKVFNEGPPQTDRDKNNLSGYLQTREAEREIVKSYLSPGFDFNNETASNYGAVVHGAIESLHQAALSNPALKPQWEKFVSLSNKSSDFMNKGIMKSDDKRFVDAVMNADPAAHAFMPTAAAKIDNNSWVNSTHSPRAYVARGQDELKAGQTQQALADALKAASLDPQNVAALSLKTEAAFKLGDYPAAARDAQAVLTINPKDKNALIAYGLSEGRNARVDDASAQALPSQGAQGGNTQSGASPTSNTVRGSSYLSNFPSGAALAFRMGNFRDALAEANAALKENPRNLAAHLLAAESYSQMGDYGQTLKSVQAGLKIDPKNSRLINLNAQSLSRLGRYRDALAASDTALEINPQNAEAYYSRAMALAGIGDKAGMLSALQEASRLRPKYQSLVDAVENLPLNSDLSLLFSGAQSVSSKKSPAFFEMDWLKEIVPHWPLGLLIFLGLSSMVLIGRKSLFEPASSLSAIEGEGVSASEGKTVILSENKIAGQYQILSRIGSGGMGVVYDGMDVNLARRVAIKHLREELQRNLEQRGRFLSEARLVAALDHPNIVRIYSIAEEKGDIYLVFEFVEGKTLQDLLNVKERLSLGEAVGIFKPVALALDYAHRHGVIHRDLKPSNIMISQEGKSLVMDFGVARVAKDALLTSQMTHTIVGTPAYMPPESQEGIVRQESDVYSLAICLYEALTGQLPFPATAAGSVNKLKRIYSRVSLSGIAAPLDAIFDRALDPDPAQRFKTPGEFVLEIEKACAIESPNVVALNSYRG
jgi:tetratricopeptide (TPR) repeat protein/tRNA A-37 threonylcarbamoyl transferase component Bud32